MWLTFGKVGRGGGDSKLVAKTLRLVIHCLICQGSITSTLVGYGAMVVMGSTFTTTFDNASTS